MQRRLSAVLIADVVDYSRLMGEDEKRTLTALENLRKQLFEPSVSSHNGLIVKRMGDGWIVEYANVSDAIASAIEIQKEVADKNVLRLRIGIHAGDITQIDDDVYGDGVNVAARLEALAEPGQVLISDTAYNSLDGKAAQRFEGGETRSLKNIARPVAVWQWPNLVVGQNDVGKADGNGFYKLDEKPSIAILPFSNLTDDPDIDFFSTGLAEDILMVLSRVTGLFVIARDSSFSLADQAVDTEKIGHQLGVRYVLEGSVRKAGKKVRVSAKLTDVQNRNPIWAENYNRTLEDIFDLQDDVTKEIVTALRVKFTDGEMAQWVSRGTSNIDAWRMAGEGFELIQRFTLAETRRARDLLTRATGMDSNYAMAWAGLGATYWYEARINPNIDADDFISRANECVGRALELDPNDAWAIGITGMIHTFCERHDEAIALTKEGVARFPGSAEMRAFYSFCLGFAGEITDAIEAMEEAIRINPLHPNWYITNLPRLYDQVGRIDEAIAVSEKALLKQGNVFSHQLFLASSYGRQGRLDEAKAMATALLELTPNFTISQCAKYLMNPNESFLERFSEGLRKAGFPER